MFAEIVQQNIPSPPSNYKNSNNLDTKCKNKEKDTFFYMINKLHDLLKSII